MADTYLGQTFGGFVDKTVKNYGVPEEFVFLGLHYVMGGHGMYTGGQTMGKKTKHEMNECYKEPYIEQLIYSIEKTRQKPSSWQINMTRAMGMLILYEWEHVRNDLDMDTCLRQYIDILKNLRPNI